MDASQDAVTARSFAWCSWHKRFSDTARLVQRDDQGSVFDARGLFACADCRKIHGLTPVADQQ
ncbi:hypothetical protein [Streptomyces regalis]|uniref:Uncharacterized protein n=1 Tax=Streptomyces regalis TaxID=68262 RepID=A0A0X3VD32_9ACTN|nr:hypothetical protein [Streptomyces regalis]KUL42713.1 hypothetical protein ADL12_09530 [Streptomyces regalis]